jgi:transposase
MTPRKERFPAVKNQSGGWYQKGRVFTMPKRLEIGYTYLQLCKDVFPQRPTHQDLATQARISKSYARKLIIELENTGSLSDPEATNSEKRRDKENEFYLDPSEELFLLALRSEKPGRPNHEYCTELAKYYGTSISTSFISDWFSTRFDYKGSFRKPNLVPLDKFRQENVIRYVEYKLKCALITDKSRFCFIDEKHLVNKDSVPKKLRACPVSGRMDFISVSGDFRKTYNLIACISSNPNKLTHCVYTMGEQNGTAAAFVNFCQMMIQTRWLVHDEVLVMDNAGIHTGRESEDLVDFFWETIVDGRPLHVLVIYLPTRSPELNPIELIFHIFSRRVRSYRMHHNAGPVDQAIIRYGSQVLEDLSYETILRCYAHCGY